jgi:hypothetical protein
MKKIALLAIFCLFTLSILAMQSQISGSMSLQFQMGQLIEGQFSDGGPHILKDSGNKIWVFFTSVDRIDAPYYHIFYTKSLDGGLTWTEPSLFVPAYLPGVYSYQVTAFQDSTDRFWIAWTNYWGVPNEDEIWFTTSSDGENWADSKALCRHGNKIGSFIEAGGRVWFFFSPRSNGFHVSYKTTADGGETWTELVGITSRYDYNPHATVLSNGTIFAVYTHYPNTIGYCSSSDGGLTWTNTLFDNPDHDVNPNVVEYNGRIYVFFRRSYQLSPPYFNSDIWFRVYDENGWTPFQQMTSDPEIFDNWPTPTYINNQIWIVWERAYVPHGPADIWIAKTLVPLTVGATIDIDPDTLNLKSEGEWITCYIELPESYDVNDINVSTILLNDTVPVELHPTGIGDYDSDGILDLMVKFDRNEVILYILANVNMTKLIEERFMTTTLTIAGYLNDGTLFLGNDSVRIIYSISRGTGKGFLVPI